MKISKLILSSLSVILFTTLIVIILQSFENKGFKKKGEVLITQIEEYRNNYGFLPETINDVEQSNVEMGPGPYYKKINETHYEVYFNIGFDEHLNYDSRTKQWKNIP